MTDPCIALVSESKIFREGIKALLEDQLPMAEEADGVTTTTQWDKDPDLILVDAEEGEERRAYSTLSNRYPRSCIVFLMRHVSCERAVDLVRFGAHGVLGPNLSAEALVLYLRLVLTGQVIVPNFVVERGPAERPLPDPPSPAPSEAGADDGVTPRERQILGMIMHGEGNKSIGLALGLREPTVKFYVKNIMRKLKLANRTQIAVWALSHGCGAGRDGAAGGNSGRIGA